MVSFEINPNDKVLVGLEEDYLSIDRAITIAEKQLKEKEDSLGDEVSNEIASLKHSIAERKELHKAHLVFIETEHSDDASAIDEQIKETATTLERETVHLVELKEKLESSAGNYEETNTTLIEAKTKRDKYQSNIDKMQENVNYLLNKKAVEDNALKLLDHAGVCSACLQTVTEEYLVEARKDVRARLEKVQIELDVYYDRISKGESAILLLDITSLSDKLENTLYSVNLNKELVSGSEKLHSTGKADLERLIAIQAEITRKYVQAKKDAELELSNDILVLKNKLDSVEHEVAKTLGSLRAELNQLLLTAPSRKDAIAQQIEDRKQSLKGEHGGKEVNFTWCV